MSVSESINSLGSSNDSIQIRKSSTGSTIPLTVDNNGSYKPLKTIPVIGLHAILAIALESYAIFATFITKNDHFLCESFFIILYMHVVFWFISLIIDHIIRFLHYKLWLNGYFQFYKRTYNHHRLPFYVTSFFITNLLLLQTLIHHFYKESVMNYCLNKKGLFDTPISLLTAVTSLEIFILVIIDVSYILKIHKFNKSKPVPDAIQLDSLLYASNSARDSNFTNDASVTHTLIEKQAEMIQFLRDHVGYLNKELEKTTS